MIYLFTSATKSYLPKVRVLGASIARYHPEMRFVIAMADRMPDEFSPREYGAANVISIQELGMSPAWIFQHSVVELSTAIKPFVFRRLLEMDDCEAVAYFDPDMALYSRLDDLFGEFKTSSILLVPHLTRQDRTPVPENELGALQTGVYNLGFAGARKDANGQAFVDWWAERLERYCFDDRPKGLFTDQKWADLVPGLFDGVAILRSSRFDVASWNAPTRAISRDGDTVLVDGKPLGFYHFTGFDSGAHDVALAKGVKPDNPLWAIVKQYRADIGKPEDASWAFGNFSNGVRITSEHRRLYRDRPDLQRMFPDPFQTDGSKSYYQWFKENVKEGVRPQSITADKIKRGLTILVKNPRQAVPLMRAFWKMWRGN